MWYQVLVALALLLIVEGILPFLSPDGLRSMMQRGAGLNDSTVRFAGLTSMVIGCLLLYAIN